MDAGMVNVLPLQILREVWARSNTGIIQAAGKFKNSQACSIEYSLRESVKRRPGMSGQVMRISRIVFFANLKFASRSSISTFYICTRCRTMA